MKILMIGNFGSENSSSNGQTIKTLGIYSLIKNDFEITVENTFKWKWYNIFFKILFLVFKYLRAESIIIIPADRAIKLMIPFLYFMRFIKNTNIHYIAIGAWLGKFLKSSKIYLKMFGNLDYVYVETSILKNELNNLNLKNIFVMRNFKNVVEMSRFNMKSNSLITNHTKPYKICTFSRVTERKGIIDVINVINEINDTNINYELYIYGPIEETFKEKFQSVLLSSKNVFYKGEISQDQVYKTLSQYFFMVFPTKIPTEGQPGTIIDAYLSGLPVVASQWESYRDFIDENTGYTYQINEISKLKDILEYILLHPHEITSKRHNCYAKSLEYDTAEASKILLYNLNKQI